MKLEESVRAIQRESLQKAIQKQIWNRLKPPTKLTISDWADEYRKLSPESSAEAGNWNTSRAEYQRGVMNALSDHSIETVVMMSSAHDGGEHDGEDLGQPAVLASEESVENVAAIELADGEEV